ncbi:MAG: putative Ig domain-containing protein, partial [Lysobacterales bacterium]
MALSLLWGSAFAAPDLLGGTATAGPGQEVTIPVDFQSDGSVVALQFDLTFDESVLTVTQVNSGTALAGHAFDWQLVSPGRLRIVVTTETLSLLGDGSISAIRFLIAPQASAGTQPLILENPVFSDATALSVIPTAVIDGNINIRIVVPGGEEIIDIPATGPLALVILILVIGLGGWVFIKRGPRGLTYSIVLGLTLFSSTIVRAVLLPGDANGDGKVDFDDIPVIVQQILERQIAPGDPDCNQDLAVNVLDTICAAQPAENEPPALSPIDDMDTLVGLPFSITAVASDPNPGDTLDFALDVFPSGMTINTVNGQISWTPSAGQLGANSVVVRVSDQDAAFDTEDFQITVVEEAANLAPDLIPPGNRIITAGQAFNTPLFATDPDIGDVLSFDLPVAPATASVGAADGTLSWTPTTDDLGVHAFTARVTDLGGLSDSEPFSIEVIQQLVRPSSNAPPVLSVPGNQTTVFDIPLILSASATDPDVGDVLTFSLVNAPAGMTIDALTGELNWTALESQIGAHDVAVKVSDPAGASAFGSFIVTVIDVNKPPLAQDDVYLARIGEILTVEAPGVLDNDSDPNGDALNAVLVSTTSQGTLDLRADGSFDYDLELPPNDGIVEM